MSVVLDRVRAAVKIVTESATDALGVWAPSEYPRARSDARDVVTAELVRGPHLQRKSQYTVCEPTEFRWTIAEPVADRRVGLSVGGVRLLADLGAAPTETTARDAVLAVLTASPWLLPDTTAAAAGADSIDFATTRLGRLYCPTAIGVGASISITTESVADIITGPALSTLELQAYAGGEGPSAASLLADIQSALPSVAIRAATDALGVLLKDPTEPFDLTTQSGAEWESRAAMRLGVTCRSYRATAVESLDAASAEISLRLPGTTPLTLEIEAP